MVSVIIPVFNGELFLERSVKSAECLSDVGEILLVEDGSTDLSLELCRKLVKLYPKCLLLAHPNGANKGAAKSRNLGIEKAKYPLIAFLDADDVYKPNRFDEALKFLNENEGVEACFGRVEVVNESNQKIKEMGFLNYRKSDSVLTYLLKGGYFHTNSVTIRTEFFKKVDLFDQTCWPHEDSELWIRMAEKGNIKPQGDEIISTYFIHGNNFSLIKSKNSLQKFWWTVMKRNFFKKKVTLLDKFLIMKGLIRSYFL